MLYILTPTETYMKKPKIPQIKTQNTRMPSLYKKLFKNEFHPYISVFHEAVKLEFVKEHRQLRVRKIGCSAISDNGITFTVDKNKANNLAPPELIEVNKDDYEIKSYQNKSWIEAYVYYLPDSFTSATFVYNGNTYEVF
ncbi:hypothetical protein [Flavobacterium sp.]|uniref:hypothetical protein n=1 Tax=Flavobacterium sp. TaxID=239 RepID=UPI0037BF66FB